MISTLNLLFWLLLFIPEPDGAAMEISDNICINSEEAQLYELINQYRQRKNLPAIPMSAALTQVAQAHVKDLNDHYKFSEKCNPHSWSKNGAWSSCCYTSDHKKASCMWDKPKEISGYESEGFEIAYWHSEKALAEDALAGWKKSSGHNPLLVNTGIWKKIEWNAIGVAVDRQYATVWFGQIKDSEVPGNCN